MFGFARASSLRLAFLLLCLGFDRPVQAQVTVYLGGDGVSTPLRGREVCGTDAINLNSLNTINYAVSTASEGVFKAIQLRAGIPKPMGRDTSTATSPFFGVSLTNPTADDVTVTEVSIQSANRLFQAIVGVTPATGWTRPVNTQLRWQGSVTLPASSAIEFICRGQPDGQSRTDEPLTITAITSVGTFNSTGAFTTTQANNNTTPAVSLYFVEGGNPAYVSSSANFAQAQTGQSKTFTVRIQESEAGNSQAVPVGAELRITIPAGFTSIGIAPSADFSVAPVTAPTGCTSGEIVATLLNTVLNRSADLSFVARAPSGLRSVALVPFDATLTSLSPAFTTRSEHVVEVEPTLPAGTRIGVAVDTALTLTPQPMSKNHDSLFGAAYANPGPASRTVTQVRMRNPGGALLFRDVFGVQPASGWSKISDSEIQWNGAINVAARAGTDFLARVQGNDLEQTMPSPIEVTITTGAGSFMNTSGATSQRDGPGLSLYYLDSDRPAAYISDVPNGAPARFRVALEENAGGTILSGSLLRVQIPARWSGITVAPGQDGFGAPTIVAPTPTNPGSIQVATTREIRRERVVLTFDATAPTNVLQSLFMFSTSFIDAATTLTSLADVLVQTIELNDGGMVVRHLSPSIVDTVMRQVAIDLRATSDPPKKYLLQVQNARTAVWESLASATLATTTTTLAGAVRSNLGDYLDAALQAQVRVASTGRDCHILQEDWLRFLIDKYETSGTSIAPITASAGFTLVPLEHLRLSVDEGLVDVNGVVLHALGNAPLADLGTIHLIHDVGCDGAANATDPEIATGTLDAMDNVALGGAGSPLFTASVGADICVVVAADITATATVGNLVGIRIDDGTRFLTSVPGPEAMPSRTGYPIASRLTLIIGADADRDGIADADETTPCPSASDGDSDDDGLGDGTENLLLTDPCNPDSDGDGLQDGLEEGIPAFTDLTDGDGDGTPDAADPAPLDMTVSSTNAALFMPDADPATRTRPRDNDTDDDGIVDGDEDQSRNGLVENFIGGTGSPGAGETDPNNLDTDADGCQDGTESGVFIPATGTNGAVFRPDLDPGTTTSPLDIDTDDDGLSDSAEDVNCNGRRDGGESDPTAAEGPALLRNDDPLYPLTRNTPSFPSIFVGTGTESLDALGGNLTPDAGEGADPTLNGSSDDDDLYVAAVTTPYIDPDGGVVGDTNRPLVFYQLAGAAAPLKLTRMGTDLVVSW